MSQKVHRKRTGVVKKQINASESVRKKIHGILQKLVIEKLDGVGPGPRSTSPVRGHSLSSDKQPLFKTRERPGQGNEKDSRRRVVTERNYSRDLKPSKIESEGRQPSTHATSRPSTIEEEGEACLSALVDIEHSKRDDLEAITNEIKKAQGDLGELYTRALRRINDLKKHLRTLTAFAEDLARLGRARDKDAEKIMKTLRKIDDLRRKLLESISDPRWEVKHHFHIFALEHWKGNEQPNLLDIAEVLPGRLLLVSLAKVQFLATESRTLNFRILSNERDALKEKLAKVEEHRKLTQGHLMDYKKMLDVMQKSMTSETIKKLESEANDLFYPKPVEVKPKPKGRGFRRKFVLQAIKPKKPPSSSSTAIRKSNIPDVDEIFAKVDTALGITSTFNTKNPSDTRPKQSYKSPLEYAQDDWSTLSKILDGFNEAQDKRKEVMKNLRAVLNCREGLKTDLFLLREQAKESKDRKHNPQTSKFVKKT